jgi:hypothetical protein
MSAKNLSNVTCELITSYGNTARNVIEAYRVGNARIASYVDQRWASAVNKAASQLSAEIRNNAVAAEQKVSHLYTRSVSLGSDGADMAVSKVVEIAGKGVTQAAANANRFDKATGFQAMHKLAAVAVPAAVAVSGVASKVEAKSDQLVRSIAGAKPKARAKRPAVKRIAVRKPAAAAKAVQAVKKPKVVKAVKTVKAVASQAVKEVSAAAAA